MNLKCCRCASEAEYIYIGFSLCEKHRAVLSCLKSTILQDAHEQGWEDKISVFTEKIRSAEKIYENYKVKTE